MQTYLFPIKTAFITFPFIALLFTLPFAIYQYRKHGYINKFRVLILYSFLLYLITAYYFIILPLPETRDIKSIQRPGTKYYQLLPFNFILDIMKETNVDFTNISTYERILSERAFLQAAFNGILLTPLGIYLRYYFKKDLKNTVIITFFVSLFFELTQISGLYGLYNAPYRLFDVDDLMLNTLGGIIGYLIAPVFTFFLPKTPELDKDVHLEDIKVGYFRRSIAVFIDFTIINAIPKVKENIILQGIAVFIYFIVIVYLTNGKTIGKYIVRIKVKGKGEKISFKEVFKRYGILYFGVFGVNKVLSDTIAINQNNIIEYIAVIASLILFIIDIIIFVHVVVTVFKRKRFFYEKISKTKIVVI